MIGELLVSAMLGVTLVPSGGDGPDIQALHHALPEAGGVLFFPPGDYDLNGLVFTKPIRLIGSGERATRLRCASGVAIAASSSFYAECLSVVGTSPLATCGLSLSGHGPTLNNVTVAGFDRGVVMSAAHEARITGCRFLDNRINGLVIANEASPDTGDHYIAGNLFDVQGEADAAIRYVSSGGAKIIGNKMLHHKYGILLDPAAGVNTSILLVSANSIEGFSECGLKCVSSGGGSFGSIAVTGNQFNATEPGAPDLMLFGAGVRDVVVSGNVIVGSPIEGRNGVRFAPEFAGGADVSGNTFVDVFTAIRRPPNGNIVGIGHNAYKGLVVEMFAGATDAGALRSSVDAKAQRPIGGVTSTTVYKPFFAVEVPNYQGVEIDVLVTGTLQGVGPFFYRRTVLATRSGDTIAVSDVLPAVASGSAIDVHLVPVGQSVQVQLKRSAAAGGTALDGVVAIDARGCVGAVRLVP